MSGQIKVFSDGSCVAGEDLSAAQYCFVKLSGDREVSLCGNGERPYGILQNKPDEGEAVEVMVIGISNVIAGDTFSAGALLGSDASGNAVEVTADQAIYGAIAREAATTAGDVVSAFIIGGGAERSVTD